MSAEQSLAFLVFAFVAAITPGPSNLMLTAAGALSGVRGGLPCLAGVGLGMGVLIFCVAMGLGFVALDHPLVLQTINWLGAAFLLWLSWKIASSKPGGGGDVKPVGFMEAAAFQWINPKSWLVAASAAGTYLRADGAGAFPQALWFTVLFLAAAAPSGFAWLVFGASMRRFLRAPRAARLFNMAMGLALAASVGLILA